MGNICILPLDSGVWSRVYAFCMPQSSETLKNTIQIGEAAEQSAMSVDTIRFYERRSLLPSMPRTTGRFRLYTADDVSRLRFIKQMQALGFSLKEIKQLLDLRDRGRHACREVKDLLKAKLGEVRAKIRELEKLEGELVLDVQKWNRELKQRQKHAPKECPILSTSNGKG